QTARGEAVPRDAADIDAVGGTDEAVRVAQREADHPVPEAFVEVRGRGKVPGDVERALLGGRFRRFGVLDQPGPVDARQRWLLSAGADPHLTMGIGVPLSLWRSS